VPAKGGIRFVFTVLVTGISGLGREELCARIPQGQFLWHDLGHEMGMIARERLLPYSDSNILRAPSATLAALRIAAIDRIARQEQAQAEGARVRVIAAHSLFQLRERLQEGLTAGDLEAMQPDMVITLIDSPQRIHERLKAHAGEYFHLTVEGIVRWQEFEVFFSNHLARDRKVPHYVVPVNQADTFTRLVMAEKKPTMYASYPMTHLPPEQRPLVHAFVEKLKEEAIVFDPGAIENPPGGKPYYAPADHRAIHSHTVVRDLDWFIGINAQAVVAYLPAMVFSSGMNDELRYAYENGRETYLVVEALSQGGLPGLSPFTTYKSKIFWSSDDFFAYLKLDAEMQQAFLVVQNEMLDALRMLKETGKPLSKADFRAQCKIALSNTRPDDWVEARSDALAKLCDRAFDRWSPALKAIRENRETPEPERYAAPALMQPRETPAEPEEEGE
jgi:adenylate kinase